MIKEKLINKVISIIENNQSEYEDLIWTIVANNIADSWTEEELKQFIKNHNQLQKAKFS